MVTTAIVTGTAQLVLGTLSLAMCLAFARLVLGPSLPDRVVALDVISMLLVGMTATYSIATNEPLLLRVAMVVALVGFMGTVAFAYYLQLSRGE